MKELKSKKHKQLIAYAAAFASWLIGKIEVEEIILFGSVARGDFDENSDVDIFVNLKDKKRIETAEAAAQKELNLFYESQVGRTWKLLGVEHEIHLLVGNLEEWKLKRSIISNGITLYGPYKSMPEDVRAYTQFVLQPIKDITLRNAIIRTLFGRKEKNYATEGLIAQYSGEKLSPLSFVVPLSHTQDIIRMLNKHKVRYILFDLWSDSL